MLNRWIEERCEAIRLALRIREFPDEADLWRLLDWLGANVRVHHAEGDGACIHVQGRGSIVVLPRRVNHRPLTWRTAHETGHALLTVGMGSLLKQMEPENPRVLSLARTWDLQDERRANDFVLAWFMPSRLVRLVDRDHELAEAAGVTEEMASRRRRQLAGAVVELDGFPRWCAARHYHCVVHRATKRAALQVVRLGRGLEPAFDFPVTNASVDADAIQLAADLVALTVDEFELKYAPFRYGRPEAVTLDIHALQQWAWGGVAAGAGR